MNTLENAKNIIMDAVASEYNVADDTLIIIDEMTVEKSYGWIFFYDSKKYLEEDDFSYAVAGNGPIVFMRETGEIIRLGTASPPSEEISQFESKRGLK